jgi:hypothetical protein
MFRLEKPSAVLVHLFLLYSFAYTVIEVIFLGKQYCWFFC